MSDLFGDLDVQSAADPFKVEDGTYDAFVTDVKVGRTKDDTKNGMTVVFKIDSDDEENGKTLQRWQQIPEPEDASDPTPDEKKQMAYLKKLLIDIGANPEDVNSTSREDLIGNKVSLTVKTNEKGYTNISKIVLLQDEGPGF